MSNSFNSISIDPSYTASDLTYSEAYQDYRDDLIAMKDEYYRKPNYHLNLSESETQDVLSLINDNEDSWL